MFHSLPYRFMHIFWSFGKIAAIFVTGLHGVICQHDTVCPVEAKHMLHRPYL